MERFTGSCLCGEINYEIRGKVGTIVHCHCSMCRKWHGTAFRTRVTAHSGNFFWSKGDEYVARYHSSENLTKTFCRNCGSSLVTYYKNMPDVVGISLGTLNEDPGIRPEFHVFVGSKAPWFEITDNLPQFETFPPDLKDVYKIPD